MSLLDAGHEIAVRVAAAARARDCSPATTTTTSTSSRATASGTPTRCSARSRRRAERVGGDPGPRRRRPGRVPADPRPDRGAGPARLRRAHLLLQDRRGVPVVAERPPAGVHDGRRPARGAQPAAPVRRSCGWPTRPGALERPGARRRSGWNASSPCTASRRMSAPLTAPAVAEPGDDQVRRPRHRAARDPRGGHREHRAVAGAGRRGRARDRRRDGRRLGAAGVAPVPRRLLHRARRRRRAGPRSTRTAARSRRRRRSAPRAPPARRPCSCSSRAGCPTATGTSPAPGRGRADAVGALVADAAAAGVVLAIEPMHPIYAADRGVISTLGQALDVAEQFPAASVGVVVDTFHVWWDPQLDEQVRRAGRPDRRATRSATGSRRSRPTPCSPAG